MELEHQKKIEESRLIYKPEKITCLFIAEAPPSDPDHFFYFEEVSDHDSLYLEMMKVLIPQPLREHEDTDSKYNLLLNCTPESTWSPYELRNNKAEFLGKFRAMGYYLIDNLDYPMPEDISGTNEKVRFLKGQKQQLLAKVKSLVDTKTPIVLISVPVFQANSGNLKYYGYNIIHSEAIEFPGSGQQAHFREKMKKIIYKITN